jgi:ubiquinone/menaquinone biosynthesis C-methylase UbiE
VRLPVWPLLGGAALAVGGTLGYRFFLHGTPCPSRLSFLLENPYMARVAGAETLLDRAGVAPGMRILDAGCGPGRLTIPAAARVGPTGEVVALDVQAAMLEKLRARLAAQGVENVRIVHGALGAGLLERGAFDRAFLVTVLGEVPEPEGALREIFESLKPGGILSVTEVLPDPDYLPRGRLRRLVEGVGYRQVAVVRGGPAFTANFQRPEERDYPAST